MTSPGNWRPADREIGDLQMTNRLPEKYPKLSQGLSTLVTVIPARLPFGSVANRAGPTIRPTQTAREQTRDNLSNGMIQMLLQGDCPCRTWHSGKTNTRKLPESVKLPKIIRAATAMTDLNHAILTALHLHSTSMQAVSRR